MNSCGQLTRCDSRAWELGVGLKLLTVKNKVVTKCNLDAKLHKIMTRTKLCCYLEEIFSAMIVF
jgi:hypothetical protein